MIQVAKLLEGQTFGELALITNKPRAATLKCLTDCHFATMDKRTFEIIKKQIKKKLDNKIDIIKSVPYFNSITHTALSKF